MIDLPPTSCADEAGRSHHRAPAVRVLRLRPV